MTIPPNLLAAYEKTLYWVRTSPNILLRPSTISDDAYQLLQKHDADSAVIITSDNPKSELRSKEENAFYRDKLQQEVIQSQCPFFLTVSVDPTGSWPDEHGFLVLDLTIAETYRLMNTFEQWAVVWVQNDGTVSLITQRVESDSESD